MRPGIEARRRLRRRAWLAVLGSWLVAGALQAADRPAPVYFSHFYVVLDKETFHALQDSALIQQLADHELATRSNGETQYTGFYIRGRHTYMEFFGDPIPEGDRVGNVGLGFAVENSGEVARIEERSRRVFADQAKLAATTFPVGSGTVPWYTATYVDAGRSDDILSTWVAEVDPGYLAARHPGAAIDRPLSRETYLAWDFKPERMLDDVVGLTLELPGPEATQLSRQLLIMGWRVSRHSSDTYTATGPDMRVIVRTVRTRGGLRAAQLRLRRAVTRQRSELGTAALELDGTSGRLVLAGAD